MTLKKYSIPFNKPHLCGQESEYILDAVSSGHISGNGKYTAWCQKNIENRFGISNCLLTTSCTDALEMAALLLNIKEGDEIIVPSYTFVSTANAFVLRGAKIVFVDSKLECPNMDEDQIEQLITPRTRAIVPVHYAGIACQMEKIMDLAKKYNLYVVEDAAQAVNGYFKDSNDKRKALGSIGHLSTFSFHETKNIISGEGGMLGINEIDFLQRAEIIWEKGTNRSAFSRNEVSKYEWKDLGSSFLPSEITAAFLFAQLEKIENIQNRRNEIWNYYHLHLTSWANEYGIQLPHIPKYSTNNAHIFYMVFQNQVVRNRFINSLKSSGISTIFHYLSLHRSPYYSKKHGDRKLPQSDRYSESLVRLPLFYDLTSAELQFIVETILEFKP